MWHGPKFRHHQVEIDSRRKSLSSRGLPPYLFSRLQSLPENNHSSASAKLVLPELFLPSITMKSSAKSTNPNPSRKPRKVYELAKTLF